MRPAGRTSPPVLTVQELLALPHGPPDHRVAYGDDSSQYGELRVPPGVGPHPVVVLFHGGCWREFSAASSIAPMAEALKSDGIATWSVEYRRLHVGGGWPATYLDAGRAVDHLRSLAQPYRLDLSRVVVVGHSAGGHLAMWVAARSRLPTGSAVHQTNPLPIRGVVDLSGTPDMAADLPGFPLACGGEDVVRSMLGGTPQTVPERYAQSSAIAMLPLGVPQALIWGARDDQVPLALAERYTQVARQAGDRVRLVVDSAAGHFESASPRSALWPAVRSAIRSLLDGTLTP
jgi:acetyl esterase/lipase